MEADTRPYFIREHLNNFTDREEVVNTFKDLLQTAHAGRLWLLTIEGNSGTGKTLLCLYLMDHVCRPSSWQSAILSFAEGIHRYTAILEAIEPLLEPSIPREQWHKYQETCARDKRDFDQYQENITINIENTAIAKDQGSLSGLNQQGQVDTTQLSRDRELRLRDRLTQELVKVARWCTRPFCLFIDGYERFEPTNPQSISDPELVRWFWEELIMGVVRTASAPVLIVTCGWQTPTHASIREYANYARLEDFDQRWVRTYLQNVGILPSSPLQSEQEQIADAFYQLTLGHPLVLSLAATYFLTFDVHERTAQHLETNRRLLNEKARTAFLQERLLARLPEPYWTLLKYGPILRSFDQNALRALLRTEDEVEPSDVLDDHSHEQFLRYPFINQSWSSSLSYHYRFHELVRQVQLEALQHDPDTLEKFHRRAANYYQELGQEDADKVEEEMERQFASTTHSGWPEIPEKVFNAFLEWAYHAFQVKELQEEAFESWVTACEITIYMHRRQSTAFQKATGQKEDRGGQTEVVMEAVRQQGSKKGQAEAVLEIARQLHKEGAEVFRDNSVAYGQYLILYARFLQREARWDEARRILRDAIEIFERLGDRSAVALCYNNLGLIYLDNNDVQEAEKNLQLALSIFREEKNEVGIAQSLNNLGLTFQGDVGVLSVDRALSYMAEAIGILQHGNDQQGFAVALGNMGLLYHRRQEFGHALNLYRQALKMFAESGDLLNIALFRNNIGRVYNEMQRFDLALNYYEEVLPIYQKIGTPENLLVLLTNIAEVHAVQKHWTEALQSYSQALAIAEEGHNIPYLEGIFSRLGVVYVEIEDWGQAEHFYSRLLRLAEDQQDTTTQGMAWYYLGVTYAGKDELPRAIQCLEKAAQLFESINDIQQIANSHDFLGDGHRELRQWQLSLQHYQQALAYIEQSHDLAMRATLLDKIGSIYREMRLLEDARHFYEEAQTAFLRLNDRTRAALTFNALGEVHRTLRHWEEALNAHEQALAFFTHSGDRANRAVVLCSLGELQYRQSLYEQALSFYEEALALRQELPESEPAQILTLLHKIGTTHLVRGDWQKALYFYDKRALVLSQEKENYEYIAISLNNIGNLYAGIGDFDLALHYLKRALEIALQHKNSGIRTYTAATAYNSLGEAYRRMGQLKQALHHYLQSVALWQQEKNMAMVATLYNNISGLHDAQQDLQRAQAGLEQSLQLCQTIYAPVVYGTTLANLGSIYRQQGRLEEALAYYQQARQLFASEVPPPNRAIVLHNTACIYREQGDIQPAIDLFRQALALYELSGTGFSRRMMDEISQLITCYELVGDVEKVNHYQGRLKSLNGRIDG